MNKQQIFDTVATHLLTQNKKSTSVAGLCLYRGPHGTKCAVGCLIADEFYTPLMEDELVHSNKVTKALSDSGIETTEETVMLLRKLQSIHDNTPVYTWKANLRNIAKVFKLSTEVLDSFLKI